MNGEKEGEKRKARRYTMETKRRYGGNEEKTEDGVE